MALYHQIPFGKIGRNNPEIISLAKVLGRTPSALAMKMCNLASFDQTLRDRNVNGLSNGSKLDKEIWQEFAGRTEEIAIRSAEIVAELKEKNIEVPCGKCLNCLNNKKKEKALRFIQEMNNYKFKLFITLTMNEVQATRSKSGRTSLDKDMFKKYIMQLQYWEKKYNMKINKDNKGDFTFVLYGADGKGQLINQNGIQSSDAIKDGLIVNSKVADNANIND